MDYGGGGEGKEGKGKGGEEKREREKLPLQKTGQPHRNRLLERRQEIHKWLLS